MLEAASCHLSTNVYIFLHLYGLSVCNPEPNKAGLRARLVSYTIHQGLRFVLAFNNSIHHIAESLF